MMGTPQRLHSSEPSHQVHISTALHQQSTGSRFAVLRGAVQRRVPQRILGIDLEVVGIHKAVHGTNVARRGGIENAGHGVKIRPRARAEGMVFFRRGAGPSCQSSEACTRVQGGPQCDSGFSRIRGAPLN